MAVVVIMVFVLIIGDVLTILGVLMLAIPYSCAEPFGNFHIEMQRKVELIQIESQRLYIKALNSFQSPPMDIVMMSYNVYLDKLQYLIQISSSKGQALTIQVLGAILQKMRQSCPIESMPGLHICT